MRSRVRGDLDDRLCDSRHRLEFRLRLLIHEGRQATGRALERARAARGAGQSSVKLELAAVNRRLAELEAVYR